MCGYSEGEFKGTIEDFWARLHPDDRERVDREIKKSFELKKDYEVEYRVIWPDQSVHWVYAKGRAFRNEQGQVVRMSGAGIDISDRKRTEQDRLNYARDLEQERELRETFVNTLTHDLRTPLTAAKTSAELVIKYPDQWEQHLRLALRIVEDIKRCDRMIRDLLDANRIRAGQNLPLDASYCDLGKISRQVLEELSRIHGDRFILVCKTPLEGYWNEDGLRRLLENLITNSVKYGDPHQPITIDIFQKDSRVLIRVHNQGNPRSSKK